GVLGAGRRAGNERDGLATRKARTRLLLLEHDRVEVERLLIAPAIVAADGGGLFRTDDPDTLDGCHGGTIGFVSVPHVILPRGPRQARGSPSPLASRRIRPPFGW